MLDFLVLVDVIQCLSANLATISIHRFKYMDYMHCSNLLCNHSVTTSRHGEAQV